MNRAEAIKRAKAETTTHVVLLKLKVDNCARTPIRTRISNSTLSCLRREQARS
jgi:hypothetical protein